MLPSLLNENAVGGAGRGEREICLNPPPHLKKRKKKKKEPKSKKGKTVPIPSVRSRLQSAILLYPRQCALWRPSPSLFPVPNEDDCKSMSSELSPSPSSTTTTIATATTTTLTIANTVLLLFCRCFSCTLNALSPQGRGRGYRGFRNEVPSVRNIQISKEPPIKPRADQTTASHASLAVRKSAT